VFTATAGAATAAPFPADTDSAGQFCGVLSLPCAPNTLCWTETARPHEIALLAGDAPPAPR